MLAVSISTPITPRAGYAAAEMRGRDVACLRMSASHAVVPLDCNVARPTLPSSDHSWTSPSATAARVGSALASTSMFVRQRL